MPGTLEAIVDEIEQYSRGAGLEVYPALLDSESMPVAEWEEGWRPFVDLAGRVGARILYLHAAELSIDAAIADAAQRAGLLDRAGADRDSGVPDLKQLLAPHLAKWLDKEGAVQALWLSWVHSGVRHEFWLPAKWHAGFVADVEKALDAMGEGVREENRRKRRAIHTEHQRRLAEQAARLATHPKWPEATNEAKRTFTAKRVFPELNPYELKEIIAEVQLRDWWG